MHVMKFADFCQRKLRKIGRILLRKISRILLADLYRLLDSSHCRLLVVKQFTFAAAFIVLGVRFL